MVNPPAIYFDWDGTLVDSYQCIQSAHDYALEQLDLEPRMEAEWFRGYFGRPREFIYQDIYGGLGSEAQKHFESFVQAHHMDLIKPMAGAAELLEGLRGLGIDLGVVSNKRPDFIAHEVESLGWGKYFVTFVGAGEAREDKPSHAPLALALERSGRAYALRDIWYVGDTEIDMRCAQNAGCRGVFIPAFEGAEQAALEFCPYKVFQNCHELYSFVMGALACTPENI